MFGLHPPCEVTWHWLDSRVHMTRTLKVAKKASIPWSPRTTSSALSSSRPNGAGTSWPTSPALP